MAMERFVERRPAYWRPLFGIRGLQDEMNRMFTDFFDETADTKISQLVPSLDVVDGKDDIQVHVELPGINREDVDISLKDDVLTIRGEKRSEVEDKDRRYSERSYGRFERRLALPSEVDEDRSKATFRNGVLTVVLPKTERARQRGRRIAITDV